MYVQQLDDGRNTDVIAFDAQYPVAIIKVEIDAMHRESPQQGRYQPRCLRSLFYIGFKNLNHHYCIVVLLFIIADHPLYAEFVGTHAKVRSPEGIGHRHGNLTAR